MVKFQIDLVLPYVNSASKIWQNKYIEFCKTHGYEDRAAVFNSERYRDWGYLKYMFRGIAYNMPFINKIFLLLQDEDQIPSWLLPDQVCIVYHKDFIPEKFLPTYNSTTIEMFLDKIPGLSEYFIYANDDLYAMSPMTADDFFTEDGKLKINFRQKILPLEPLQFDIVCCNCFNMIQKALTGVESKSAYLNPYHEYIPMIKTHVRKVRVLFRSQIEEGITPFRDSKNHNQYIYSYYELFTKNIAASKRKYIYMNMENNIDVVSNIILKEPADVFVLNDSEKTNVTAWANNKQIISAFEMRWPQVSRFEKRPIVSICIALYNSANNIESCLSHIPKSEDIEIVVIDDVSTDNTLEILSSHMKEYPKFQIILTKEHSGLAYCKNALCFRATGEYVFFLDENYEIETENFLKILKTGLNDRTIIIGKDAKGATDIAVGSFIKRSYIGDLGYLPNDEYSDESLVNRLASRHGGTIENAWQADCTFGHKKTQE